jgi:hypothetical protein
MAGSFVELHEEASFSFFQDDLPSIAVRKLLSQPERDIPLFHIVAIYSSILGGVNPSLLKITFQTDNLLIKEFETLSKFRVLDTVKIEFFVFGFCQSGLDDSCVSGGWRRRTVRLKIFEEGRCLKPTQFIDPSLFLTQELSYRAKLTCADLSIAERYGC